jgi:hypothetical protein
MPTWLDGMDGYVASMSTSARILTGVPSVMTTMTGATAAVKALNVIRRGRTLRMDIHEVLCTAPDSDTDYMDECGPPDLPDRDAHEENKIVLKFLKRELTPYDKIVSAIESPSTLLKHNLVILGGPAHGPGLAMALMGTDEEADPFDGLPYELGYNFELITAEAPAHKRMTQDGREVIGRNWCVRAREDSRALYAPELGTDGFLKSDLLLISRLPNVFHSGEAVKRRIVSIAGTHGIGTKGLKLLFKDHSLLRDFYSKASDHDCFQVLYEVRKVKHRYVARRITKVGEFVPISAGEPANRRASSLLQERWTKIKPLLPVMPGRDQSKRPVDPI